MNGQTFDSILSPNKNKYDSEEAKHKEDNQLRH